MERPRLRRARRRSLTGFTLVELLVVIAIIGVLVGLLLPAVQAAREAARRTQCTNQVRQIMLGMINMESARGAFPSGGIVPWPQLENYLSGAGGAPYGPEKQGLGWSFQILPYLENNAIYDLKTTAAVESVNPQGFNCPSRRGPTQGEVAGTSGAYPFLIDYAAAVPLRSNGQMGIAPGGTNNAYNVDNGDTTACLAQAPFWGAVSGSAPVHADTMQTATQLATRYYGFWGVVVRSNLCSGCGGETGFYTKVSYNKIPDGSSNTMVIGEKRLQPSLYAIGAWHDDKGYSGGWDTDALRSTGCKIGPDEDNANHYAGFRFGSAHASVMNAGFADGSVTAIGYDIDQLTFNRLGHRDDGAIVNKDEL